jgi:hypothetical protein
MDDAYSKFLEIVDKTKPSGENYASAITELRAVLVSYQEFFNATKQNLALVQCFGEEIESIDAWVNCADEYKARIEELLHEFKSNRHDHWQRSDEAQQKRVEEYRARGSGSVFGNELQEQSIVWLREQNLKQSFEEKAKSITSYYSRRFANRRDESYGRILAQVSKITDANEISRNDVGFESPYSNRWHSRYRHADSTRERDRIL